jgi:hypothetical protein
MQVLALNIAQDKNSSTAINVEAVDHWVMKELGIEPKCNRKQGHLSPSLAIMGFSGRFLTLSTETQYYHHYVKKENKFQAKFQQINKNIVNKKNICLNSHQVRQQLKKKYTKRKS